MAPLRNANWERAALARAGGDPPKAAYQAGGMKYHQASASRFFSRPDIAARVAEIQAERDAMERELRRKALEEANVDRPWIIRHLKINALAAMRGDPVYRLNKKTGEQEIAYYKPDRHAANRSLELLGKAEGVFIDRVEMGGPGDFAQLSDEALDQRIGEIVKGLGVPEQEAVKLLQYLKPTDNQETAD